nr:ATP-binding protein [Acidimicrobiia bacterium]
MSYLPRVVDAELRHRLQYSGGVLIEGPKACGKTSTGKQQAVSFVYLDLEPQLRQLAELDPSLILGEPQERPRLIDEWQTAPAIWNHVRRAVDISGAPGQFILTASARPPGDITRHSGAGRISRLRMRTMSLFESGDSTGEVSLRDVLAGAPPPTVTTEVSVADVSSRIVKGGWPALLDASPEEASRWVADYVREVCNTDIHEVDNARRDPARVRRVIQSLARNVATQAATTVITRDAGLPPDKHSGGGNGPHRSTVIEYLAALERLMLVEDQPAWTPRLRSRTRVRGKAKRHFVDPSVAVAALEASVAALRRDVEMLGLLFESLVVRDLRVYAQHSEGEVLHYRDETGLEVDAVVTTRSGEWAAFEVELGTEEGIEVAARNLLRFASERVDTKRAGEPSRLAVIVASGVGFTRKDGVAVIPIGALGP